MNNHICIEGVHRCTNCARVKCNQCDIACCEGACNFCERMTKLHQCYNCKVLYCDDCYIIVDNIKYCKNCTSNTCSYCKINRHTYIFCDRLACANKICVNCINYGVIINLDEMRVQFYCESCLENKACGYYACTSTCLRYYEYGKFCCANCVDNTYVKCVYCKNLKKLDTNCYYCHRCERCYDAVSVRYSRDVDKCIKTALIILKQLFKHLPRYLRIFIIREAFAIYTKKISCPYTLHN